MESRFSRLHPHRWTVFIALGFSFFGSLILAAMFFPRGYDWRHTVISSLASPRDNPRAYGIACAGLAVSGLLLAPFSFLLRKRLRPFAPRLASWAAALLFLGAVCLTLSALIVPGHQRLFGIARSHEHLAQMAAVLFCLSLVLCLAAILRTPSSFLALRIMTVFVVVLPVTALTVSRLSLFVAYECFSTPVYRAIRVSLWSSLALWEWVGACCLYLFLGLMTACLPDADGPPWRDPASTGDAHAKRSVGKMPPGF